MLFGLWCSKSGTMSKLQLACIYLHVYPVNIWTVTCIRHASFTILHRIFTTRTKYTLFINTFLAKFFSMLEFIWNVKNILILFIMILEQFARWIVKTILSEIKFKIYVPLDYCLYNCFEYRNFCFSVLGKLAVLYHLHLILRILLDIYAI